MKTTEAAELVEVILESMRRNPAQFVFHVEVTTVGAIGVGGPGGHGIVGIANGPGVGVYASASAPTTMQIQISERAANEELNVQFQAAQRALEAIVQELRAQTMSAEKRDSFVAQLKSTWLPNVLVSLVTAILSGAIAS